MSIRGLLFLLVLALFAALLIGSIPAQHRAVQTPDQEPRWSEAEIRAELVKDYEPLNDAWFDGKLPHDTTVSYNEASGRYIGVTHQVGDHFDIFINSYYDRSVNEAEFTELHEMCHVAVAVSGYEYEQHGPRWQRCMLRLAQQGAFTELW